MEERQEVESGEEMENGKRFCSNSKHRDCSASTEHSEATRDTQSDGLKEDQRVLEKDRSQAPCKTDKPSVAVVEKGTGKPSVVVPGEEVDAGLETEGDGNDTREDSAESKQAEDSQDDSDGKASSGAAKPLLQVPADDRPRVSAEERGIGDRPKKQIFEDKGEFVPGKIPASTESIFSRPGVQKQKKDSSFLSGGCTRSADVTDNASRAATKPPDGQVKKHWTRSCRLSYFEGGDCIDIGTGEAHIKNHSLVFVRDLFKVVILNFPCRNTEFKNEKHLVFFRAKSKKSTGDSFEIVEREYAMEFHNESAVDEFLGEVKK